MEIVWGGEAKFCLIKQTESQVRLGEVENVLALRVAGEQTILCLEVTLRNNDAGVCDGRAVGSNGWFRVSDRLPAKTNGSPQGEH